MGCINNTVKFILFAINSLFSLFAIVFIACGALILYLNDDVPVENYLELFLIPVMTIVCGCLLFFIIVFGCCGVIAEKSCLLLMYVTFMLLLMAGKIYVAVQIHVIDLVALMEDTFNNIFKDSSTRDIFYIIENLFTCCGTTGADSYENINVTLPITCCPLPEIPEIDSDLTQFELCSKEDAYTGCTEILIDLVKILNDGAFYSVIAVIVLEAISIIFALYLMYDFSKKKKLIAPAHPEVPNRGYYYY